MYGRAGGGTAALRQEHRYAAPTGTINRRDTPVQALEGGQIGYRRAVPCDGLLVSDGRMIGALTV